MQARPCIFQPGNFTHWDSEGVNESIRKYTITQNFHQRQTSKLRETLKIVVAVAVGVSFPAERSAGVSNCTLTACIPLAKKIPCATLSFI